MRKLLARVLLGTVLIWVGAASLRAELKYSTHTETKPGAPDPLAALLGPMISVMFPQGGLDATVVMGEKGSRVETKQATLGLPAGVVIITKPDGSSFGLDPAAKTFWKQPSVDAASSQMAQMGMKPTVTAQKTGEFETIDGKRAEKILVTIAVPLPIDPSQLPPGFPTEISAKTTVWMTDAVKMPAGAPRPTDTSALARFGVANLKELNDGRFMIKSVTQMFGTEISITVTNVTTEAVPATLFDVPADYKEVAPPGIGGVGAVRQP